MASNSNENTNDVYIFLKENNLTEYWSSFDYNGYDDLKQLQEMTTDEIEEVLRDDVGIQKRGHRKRLQALLAVQSVRDRDRDRKDNAAKGTLKVGLTCRCFIFQFQPLLYDQKVYRLDTLPP